MGAVHEEGAAVSRAAVLPLAPGRLPFRIHGEREKACVFGGATGGGGNIGFQQATGMREEDDVAGSIFRFAVMVCRVGYAHRLPIGGHSPPYRLL